MVEFTENFIRRNGLRVAIAGRPNVGKSTLFNRLAGKKIAIVHDTPGVTRDRKEAFGQLADIPLVLIDTAGLEQGSEDLLMAGMWTQASRAFHEAEVVLFVFDAREGLTADDETLARFLRKQKKPMILVANKCEGKAGSVGIGESYRLGFGEPVAISAEHGEGLGDLYDALELHYRKKQIVEEVDAEQEEELGPLQLAILGRPNVGKSTLLNHMIGDERVLTGPEAGVTRDAISVEWEFEGKPIRLIDTAGIRKRAKVVEKLERLAVGDSYDALKYAHVAILVLDAMIPLEKQDLQIASRIVDEGRALVVALNKWDLITNKDVYLKEIREELENLLPQIRGVPLIPIVATKGKNLHQLMKTVLEMYEIWNIRIPTSKLNRWLEHIVDHHPPPLINGRRIKIKYMTQIKSRPPTFVLFCSKAMQLPDSYSRYLVNSIRKDLNLPGVPIRLMVRSGENPYDKK
ncbi:ribosome biogenesis GTPase Der [Candidatus Bealeia paramacronuclearis]|uniref:GTPase Der n=1 Tax=Candidatus Bealeia paramacronuclearis TaxID=1921001 RepID=A0ABZ2C3I6_9PROT|nr:ribosome biogenesis GTPase Der [Candidatus Bealeia paramacronuclearis]